MQADRRTDTMIAVLGTPPGRGNYIVGRYSTKPRDWLGKKGQMTYFVTGET